MPTFFLAVSLLWTVQGRLAEAGEKVITVV